MPSWFSSAQRLIRSIHPKWIAIVLFGLVIVLIAIGFVYATTSAWRAQESAGLSCGSLSVDAPHTYIQYSIKDQAVEPYFQGSIFINLGEASTPLQADVVTTAGRTYANTVTHVEFFRDEQNKTFWMRKESSEVPFVRTSGSARDFPFDSAIVDFDTTFQPSLPIRGLVLRNFNPSFYIPCNKVVSAIGPEKIHLRFEMHRKPLVQLMALVIIISATLFVLIIPFSVKKDALPTSVASFFFSVWSTRGILASEMKVFPTQFDVAILALCVLLLLLIGVRLLLWWVKPAVTDREENLAVRRR